MPEKFWRVSELIEELKKYPDYYSIVIEDKDGNDYPLINITHDLDYVIIQLDYRSND